MLSVHNFRGGVSRHQRSDLFWISSAEYNQPILYEYSQTHYAVSEGFAAELMSKGIRIVETHGSAQRIAGSEVWLPGREFFFSAMNSLLALLWDIVKSPTAGGLMPYWTACQKFQFAMLVNARRDFYRHYNVKVEFIAGLSLAEPAHSAALNCLGGVTCVTQYSTGIDHLGSHTSTATFHLHFGGFVKMWRFPFLADYNILNGYLYKSAVRNGEQHAQEIRGRFTAMGVRRNVGFLDEGFWPEEVRRSALEIYRALCLKVLEEHDFGVVVKPKKNSTTEVLRRELGECYREAVSTGRLVMLDSTYYPGYAGLGSDLTIGILGTASFECAVLACRTIYLNPFGFLPAFMKHQPDNVFNSVAETMEAVERFFVSGPTGSDVGCHTEDFLKLLDHQRDNEVSQRIECLLMTSLRELNAGASRSVAIRNAIAALESKWPITYLEKSSSSMSEPLVPVGSS